MQISDSSKMLLARLWALYRLWNCRRPTLYIPVRLEDTCTLQLLQHAYA